MARRARDPLIQRTFAGSLALSPTARSLSRARSSRGEIITEILGESGTKFGDSFSDQALPRATKGKPFTLSEPQFLILKIRARAGGGMVHL